MKGVEAAFFIQLDPNYLFLIPSHLAYTPSDARSQSL